VEEEKEIFNQAIRICKMNMVSVFGQGSEGWLVVLSLFQGLLIQFMQLIDHQNVSRVLERACSFSPTDGHKVQK